MAHCVLMHIVQPGQERLLKSNSGFPILKPNLLSLGIIQSIHRSRCLRVQMRNKFPQILRLRGFSDEVIVIGKYGPGLKVPRIAGGQFKERFGKQLKTFRRMEVWKLFVCSRSDHEYARVGKLVKRAVRPVAALLQG